MLWQRIGSVSIGPADFIKSVGTITVPVMGGVPVRVTQTTTTPSVFGFCLLSFRSTAGYELGTIRVWPKPTPTVYMLGEGLRASEPAGELVIEPRTWNLRWIQAGFTLTVQVDAFVPFMLPADRYLPPGITADGEPLPIEPAGPLGRVRWIF